MHVYMVSSFPFVHTMYSHFQWDQISNRQRIKCKNGVLCHFFPHEISIYVVTRFVILWQCINSFLLLLFLHQNASNQHPKQIKWHNLTKTVEKKCKLQTFDGKISTLEFVISDAMGLETSLRLHEASRSIQWMICILNWKSIENCRSGIRLGKFIGMLTSVDTISNWLYCLFFEISQKHLLEFQYEVKVKECCS